MCFLFVGSVVGLNGNAGQCVYSASKAGLEGFTRSLAKEVASRNVRVNLLAPGTAPSPFHIPVSASCRSQSRVSSTSGFVRTDMTSGLKEEDAAGSVPLGRFGEPEEVAQAVLFLLETPYVTGQVLVVDGGLRLAV